MRKIAHISDLHFGTELKELELGVLKDLEEFPPDVVVISGDLTQRARTSQYKKARAFIDKINYPKVVVPGNHDIPLFDAFSRFLLPLTRYKKYISEDLSPLFRDEEIAILGVNTARSLTWKNGRISIEQIEEIERAMCAIGDSAFKILVTHHPFIPPSGDAGIELVGRSVKALNVIDKCGVELLLAGHVHHGYSGDIRPFYPSRKRSVISAQAGTAISNRIRNEPNAYNFITINGNTINIQIRKWGQNKFAESANVCYQKNGKGWVQKEKEEV
jgi:3',5'-cyclic AMP phosphodiesterase CpdA